MPLRNFAILHCHIAKECHLADMKLTSIVVLLALFGVVVGCGSTVDPAGQGGSGNASSSSSSGSSGGGGASPCETSGSSTLPGVSIEFTANDCTFTVAEAAAGIQIGYQVVVANDVPNVHPLSQDTGCGGAGPSLLYVFENLGDNGQNYCICDQGLCPGSGPDPVTIPQGTYAASFSWDGKNWSGPSDTGMPKGAAFPPGDYTLTVSSKGDFTEAGVNKPYEVIGKAIVHLVP